MAGEPDLHPGDSGDWVTHLQGYLQYRGYQLELTGQYDAATSAVVAQFQQAAGLEAHGSCDAATWAALEDVPSGTVQEATTGEVEQAYQTHGVVELLGQIDVREGLILYMVANRGEQPATDIKFGMQVNRVADSGEELVFESAETGDDLHPGLTAERFVYIPTFEDGSYNVWLDIVSSGSQEKTNRYFDLHDGHIELRS